MPRIFFHIACMGESWKQVVDEMINAFMVSGLYDRVDEIYAGVLGQPGEMAFLKRNYPGEKITWHHHDSDIQRYEFPTLEALAAFAAQNPGEKILYCHTKGVTRSITNPYWKYWRRYMTDSCILQYQKHIAALENYDVSGDMWSDGTHFSGNFWWANAAHITQLPELQQLKANPVVIWEKHSAQENFRLQCEMWLGMRKNIKVKDHGINNMKPGFALNIVGKTDPFPCPLNDMGFGKIYLINLTSRTDRLTRTLREFNKVGLKGYSRFSAINAGTMGITHLRLNNPGLVGCFLSHYFILQEAILNNYKHILIFEDDVTFVNGFNEILAYSLKQLPSDWQLVYLGYTEREGINTYKKRLSENITLPNDPWGTQAYMVQNDGISILFEHMKEIKDHLDIQMSRHIIPQMAAYEIFPSLCPQSGMKSDIVAEPAQFDFKKKKKTFALFQ